MPLAWDRQYAIGVPALDAQHREIILRLRWLGDAIGGEQGERIGVVLGELAQLVKTHFEDEERWMAEEGYPFRDSHARSHGVCAKSLDTAVRLHAEAGVSVRFVEVLERVARWLDVHLRSEDLRLGRHRVRG
jgi:hemerythrin